MNKESKKQITEKYQRDSIRYRKDKEGWPQPVKEAETDFRNTFGFRNYNKEMGFYSHNMQELEERIKSVLAHGQNKDIGKEYNALIDEKNKLHDNKPKDQPRLFDIERELLAIAISIENDWIDIAKYKIEKEMVRLEANNQATQQNMDKAVLDTIYYLADNRYEITSVNVRSEGVRLIPPDNKKESPDATQLQKFINSERITISPVSITAESKDDYGQIVVGLFDDIPLPRCDVHITIANTPIIYRDLYQNIQSRKERHTKENTSGHQPTDHPGDFCQPPQDLAR